MAEHHRTATVSNRIDLDLDSSEFARYWNQGWQRGMGVLGFKVDSRERVDEIYRHLVEAGYRGQQPPYDAFWAARPHLCPPRLTRSARRISSRIPEQPGR